MISVRHTLPKKEILRGYQSFSNVLSGGKSYQQGIVRCFLLSTVKKGAGIKVGFALARGIQPAARRNRIKRLLRESYRKNKQILAETISSRGNEHHLVFMIVPEKGMGKEKSPILGDVERGVIALLKQVEFVLRTTPP